MSTQPQTKYPGADTSKERLASIDPENISFGEPEWYEMVRDLLAMIEERDATIAKGPIGWTSEEVGKLLVERDRYHKKFHDLKQLLTEE